MVKKHCSAFWKLLNIMLFIRTVCQRSCTRSIMIPRDKGYSLSSVNVKETYVTICLGVFMLRVLLLQYNSIVNITCTVQTQTEHKQQYFKNRSSLRKCGCPMNPKLELGITLEQLSGKSKPSAGRQKGGSVALLHLVCP